MFSFVVLIVLCSGAQVLAQNVTMDAEARLNGGTAITGTTYKWIVPVYDVSGATKVFKGPGAVVKVNWVITSSTIGGSYTGAGNAIKLAVYKEVTDSASPSGRIYRVKEVVTYSSAKVGILHDIILLRVCPDLVDLAPLPAAPQTYAFGTPATYVNYATVIQERTGRQTGLPCQCEYTNYDAAYHFCLDEADTNYIVAADVSSICIINGKFAGINVGLQNNGGEPYLDMSKYLSFVPA